MTVEIAKALNEWETKNAAMNLAMEALRDGERHLYSLRSNANDAIAEEAAAFKRIEPISARFRPT